MKPYDKSNSFMRRVTKRVTELLPGTTWMNMLLGESQPDDDPSSASEHDDQPPVKRLCTSNNTFANANNRTCVDSNSPINSTENHRNSYVLLPEISAVTCVPGTSRQNPKCIGPSNSSLLSQDNGNRSSSKRKSDVSDLSNINRQSPKTLAFNFASSTPTLGTGNKQTPSTPNLKRSLNADKLSSSHELSTTNSSKVIKPRENESQSLIKYCVKQNTSLPSFRWDTFVNYGELSERQKLFAQKSPLNCSRVMYGGNSARSNLSKLLGNNPPIHKKKAVIPISPTNNSEIRTTSSILLGHIAAKDKEIEENKFIIQPKVHLRHKAEQKTVPLKVETTLKVIKTTPEKTDERSNNVSLPFSGPDTSRKLRANISKKARGLKSEELEMPAKVDLPNISLPVPVLPTIKLSDCNADDNEFTFNQPLTLEQFSLQIADKTCQKNKKISSKKAQGPTVDVGTTICTSSSPLINTSNSEILKIKTEKKTNDCSIGSLNKNNELSFSKFSGNSKDILNKSIQNSDGKLEQKKPTTSFNSSSPQVLECKNNSQSIEKLPLELKKWTCDACWVPNDGNKDKCVACQTPKSSASQKPIQSTKSSSTWTCDSCWVPNKSDVIVCVACQTQKPGTAKNLVQSSAWTCDACWVKNKSDSTSCISCGTVKPGSENKSQPSSQFKFGLNNNTFETSSGSQFKFGFDSSKTDQPSSQFKFGSNTTFQTSENIKSNTSVGEFKFGEVNNKVEQPKITFKFGSDTANNLPIGKPNDLSNDNNIDQPSNQFKFGFEKKPEQSEDQIQFGVSTSTFKPIPQFKFGSDNVETEKSVKQNLATINDKVLQPTSELQCSVNNKIEVSNKPVDAQSKSCLFKFGDTKQSETSQKVSQATFGSTETNCNNLTSQKVARVTFGSIETNCNNSNSLNNVGFKNEDLSNGKFAWDKNDKVELKSTNLGGTQTVQTTVGNTSTNQLVNGHSHSNETLNDHKSNFNKTQLFSFSSLAKQDQNLPDDQKQQKTFTFGSATNDNKTFGKPSFTASSFPSSGLVFGSSNPVFGSGSSTTTPTTLGSSVVTPKFSFGSMAPPTSNNLFSMPVKDSDKNTLALTSTSKVGFSFGNQSSPTFSVPNATGMLSKSVQDDQSKSTTTIFKQPNMKTVKMDPTAPISINFTGGTTTQFTAKSETTEPPTKRKILKPVRRIR